MHLLALGAFDTAPEKPIEGLLKPCLNAPFGARCSLTGWL